MYRLPLRRFTRCYSISKIESDRLGHAARKKLIAEDPQSYYPPIQSTRGTRMLKIPEFVNQWSHHDFNQYDNKRFPELYQVEGKIRSIRASGKGMYFIDVIQGDSKLQILANNKLMNLSKDEFHQLHSFFRKGDIISGIGYPSTTNVGELSLKLSQPIRILTPCLNSTMIPEELTQKSKINTNRVLNYLVNQDSIDTMKIRSHIIQSIRTFFLNKQYLEVQTPILTGAGTGANAQPFTTHLKNSFFQNQPLQLRVAPELWLKKMVIGGFEKIFEIGVSFRNEGIDSTHNPEFTTCEFYQAYTSLPELIEITENLFQRLYLDLSTLNVPLLEKNLPDLVNLSKGNFPKYEFIPTLESITGKTLPSTLDSESLVDYHRALNQSLPSNLSSASLLDNLASIYLEPIISSKHPNTPVFLYNQPAELSPLAKSTHISYSSRSYEISLRFECFINGKEYINAYEEENNPFEQAKKFKLQQVQKADYNDNESLIPDWNYVNSLEYGLPPTGGWGCGIDRLCMLFVGSDRIESVLPFGGLKDVFRN